MIGDPRKKRHKETTIFLAHINDWFHHMHNHNDAGNPITFLDFNSSRAKQLQSAWIGLVPGHSSSLLVFHPRVKHFPEGNLHKHSTFMIGVTTMPATPSFPRLSSLGYAGVATAWICFVTHTTAPSSKLALASSLWVLYFAVVFRWRSATATSVMVSTIRSLESQMTASSTGLYSLFSVATMGVGSRRL